MYKEHLLLNCFDCAFARLLFSCPPLFALPISYFGRLLPLPSTPHRLIKISLVGVNRSDSANLSVRTPWQSYIATRLIQM